MDKPVPEDQTQTDSDTTTMQEKQMRALSAMYKVAAQQQKLLDEMLVQQKAQTEWLISIGENLFPDNERFPGRQSVKINDINMPFSALVGFLLKVAFASIPAAIIFYMIMVVLGVSLLSGLLGIGNGLAG